MLPPSFLVLFSAVFPAQASFPYQSQQFQFVDVGGKAQISCASPKEFTSVGECLLWYKRTEDQTMVSVGDCSDQTTNRKFVCKTVKDQLILEIFNAQADDSGLYLCAERGVNFFQLSFQGSSTLVVGDSYTPNTWVMLLHPALPAPPSQSSRKGRQLACVVHGVSSFIRVSWNLPGNLRQSGQTLPVKNSSGSLTFISLLFLPADLYDSKEHFTCEVTFNSSGTSVAKTILYKEEADQQGTCSEHVISVAVLGGLILLLVLLSFLWVRFCPSRPGFQPGVPELAFSEVSQEEICYSQLHFLPKNGERKKRRGASPENFERHGIASGQTGDQL